MEVEVMQVVGVILATAAAAVVATHLEAAVLEVIVSFLQVAVIHQTVYTPGRGGYTPGGSSYILQQEISSTSGVGVPLSSCEAGYDVRLY